MNIFAVPIAERLDKPTASACEEASPDGGGANRIWPATALASAVLAACGGGADGEFLNRDTIRPAGSCPAQPAQRQQTGGLADAILSDR